MRLRNIPRAESVLSEHDKVVKDEKTYRGNWGQVFGNSNPIHIEWHGKRAVLTETCRTEPTD